VLEKRTSRGGGSRAIGITPTSLEILEEIGLLERFLGAGLRVRRAAVHSGQRLLVRVQFDGAPLKFPFILSLPQAVTERLLLEALASLPSVRLHTGWEVLSVRKLDEGLAVLALGAESGQTWFRAGLLCVCDGSASPLARELGIPRRMRRYPFGFVMADYRDRSGLGEGAHLFFTRRGSVESFPMSSGIRRWIVLAASPQEAQPSFELVEREVLARAGYRLREPDRIWSSAFIPERSELARFRSGRVVFCGDAAHTMPPIGGHGMNSGFADARLLAWALERTLRGGAPFEELTAAYERYRKRSFRAATRRARWFMTFGTTRRPIPRWLLDRLVVLLAHPPFLLPLARHFAMLNVPYSTLASVLRRERSLRLQAEGHGHESRCQQPGADATETEVGQ
jgi:2-polyprenyl-6-methoxyphenol hydroxylase-like FAD-dependent oxidoreductase